MSVVIETTLGDITVDLFTEERPQTCKNFLKLCKLKYYNFSLFHTVQANFIAQTGDPTGTGSGGESVYGVLYGPEQRYYEAENMPKMKHSKPGLLSMVNCGDNMLGSQFFVTLGSDLQSLDEHCIFGEVTEGQDVLLKLNEAVCDFQHKPFRDIRITHTVILDDPFEDLQGMKIPDASPDLSQLPASNGRLGADEEVGDELTGAELEEAKAEQEARARATILEIVGDIPHADIAPPENVLFVCKLNPITNDEDLEVIFGRFGKINSCEVIRDHVTQESLQYAFIEFADKKSCELAYGKMDNVLIDDRRIHVDFSQSVSRVRWKGKGRGVELIEKPEDNQPKPLMDLRYSSASMMSRGRDQQQYYSRERDRDRDRRGRDDRRREDGRRHREDDRRDDRRRDDDRRRRERPDSRRTDTSSSRRHRDYTESRHGRSGDEPSSEIRQNRRYDESSQDISNNHRSSRHDERSRESLSDYKHIKPLMEKSILKPVLDTSNIAKSGSHKNNEISPSKHKVSPYRKEEKSSGVAEEDRNSQEIVRNESITHSIVNSDITSSKHSDEKKKKKNMKKKIVKKKRRSSSTSSNSSDSSVSSSSSSSYSSSSSSSSSSRERIILKKNGKSKKHRRSGILTKKYYDRKGKLIKVVKKHRKDSSSSSDSSSDLSDNDRKRSKKKHRKKKKKKLAKSVKKGGKRSSDEIEEDEESGDSASDDGERSKSSKASVRLKKRKQSKVKNNKKEMVRNSEGSDNDDENHSNPQSAGHPPDKKKLKPSVGLN